MKSIIELAKQAGMRLDKHNGGFVNQSELIRFAALIRAQALEEVAHMVGACDPRATPKGIAAAIRVLKEK